MAGNPKYPPGSDLPIGFDRPSSLDRLKTYNLHNDVRAAVYTTKDKHGTTLYKAVMDVPEDAIMTHAVYSEYDAVNDLANVLENYVKKLRDRATEIYQTADND